MSKFAHRAVGLFAALCFATGALAEATRPLDAISACRLDDERIVLRFTFEGGGCQQAGQGTVARGRDGVGLVTVPTTNAGEMCTMQVAQIPFEQVLAAGKPVTTLDITLLNPVGGRQALGSTDISTGPEPCEEPAAAAQ